MTTTTTPPLLLHDLIDPTLLQTEIDEGWITRKTHPTLPLSIFTYTRACQYDRHWTPATINCRGLIAHDVTGPGVTIYDLFAPDRDDRVRAAQAREDEPVQEDAIAKAIEQADRDAAESEGGNR